MEGIKTHKEEAYIRREVHHHHNVPRFHIFDLAVSAPTATEVRGIRHHLHRRRQLQCAVETMVIIICWVVVCGGVCTCSVGVGSSIVNGTNSLW